MPKYRRDLEERADREAKGLTKCTPITGGYLTLKFKHGLLDPKVWKVVILLGVKPLPELATRAKIEGTFGGSLRFDPKDTKKYENSSRNLIQGKTIIQEKQNRIRITPPHRQSARQREGRDRLSAMNADKKDKFLVCPKKAKNGEKQVMQANAFLKINKILSGL